jgi:hypothetical protein
MGPVEVVILSFRQAGLVASVAPILSELVAAGHLRVIDAILVSVHEGDTVVITDLDDSIVPSWSSISTTPRPMLSASDAELAAVSIDSGGVALMVALEQIWPARIARLTAESGGQVALHVRVAPSLALTASRVSA